jgi:hypothetical protein
MNKIEVGYFPQEGITSYQDVPEIETTLTSSVGGLWPPEKASFDRMKAFYTGGVVNRTETLNEIVDSFVHCISASDNGASRVQFRFLTEGDHLRELSKFADFRDYVEAVVELDPGEWGKNPVLVYFSANTHDRPCNSEDMNRVIKHIDYASLIQEKPVDEIYSRLRQQGYQIQTLQIPENELDFEALLDQTARLYARFGWERDDVAEILHNPNNLFASVFQRGELVSAAIAEFAHVPMRGHRNLEVVEITEAATLEEHQNKGLYAAVSTQLMIELAGMMKQGVPIDLVFGECNGLSQGVLVVAKQQGRHFATEVGARYGFDNSGVLFQQVPISGPERHTPFNDLVPAYFTGNQLLKKYGTYAA